MWALKPQLSCPLWVQRVVVGNGAWGRGSRMVVWRVILQSAAGWDLGLKVPGDAQPCTGGSSPGSTLYPRRQGMPDYHKWEWRSLTGWEERDGGDLQPEAGFCSCRLLLAMWPETIVSQERMLILMMVLLTSGKWDWETRWPGGKQDLWHLGYFFLDCLWGKLPRQQRLSAWQVIPHPPLRAPATARTPGNVSTVLSPNTEWSRGSFPYPVTHTGSPQSSEAFPPFSLQLPSSSSVILLPIMGTEILTHYRNLTKYRKSHFLICYFLYFVFKIKIVCI